MANDYSIDAPAKINLGLRVGDQRADGFHEIRTIFQTISLHDRLEIDFSDDLTEDVLRLNGPVSLDGDGDNLVLETMRRLRDRWNELPFAEINLTKKIPVGSGLGGGSSDAGAVLQVILRAFPDRFTEEEIMDIAVNIGADVPFFMEGGTAVGEGIGEALQPITDLVAEVVVAVPPVKIDTEWAYNHFEEHLPRNRTHNNINFSFESDLTPDAWKSLDLTNDFEPLVVSQHEIEGDVRESLKSHSQHCSLSGSGSALFALFERDEDAKMCVKKVEPEFPDVQFFHEQFIPSDQIPVWN